MISLFSRFGYVFLEATSSHVFRCLAFINESCASPAIHPALPIARLGLRKLAGLLNSLKPAPPTLGWKSENGSRGWIWGFFFGPNIFCVFFGVFSSHDDLLFFLGGEGEKLKDMKNTIEEDLDSEGCEDHIDKYVFVCICNTLRDIVHVYNIFWWTRRGASNVSSAHIRVILMSLSGKVCVWPLCFSH